jgi:site-specific DNA recombinase
MNSDGVVVGYVRVSSVNQVENGAGLAIQKKRIAEFCKEKGFELARFYEEKGVSGTVRDRPALLSLLKDCEEGKIKRVVVFRHDRLAREITTAIWIETQLKKYDIELSSVLDPELDTSDPLQAAFRNIIHVFSQLEKELIVFRLREGRIDTAENGKKACGALPFGYSKTGDALEINPKESEFVEKIFHWAAKGLSYSKIAENLNKTGMLTRRGKPFQIESVKYILRNSVYYGEATFGKIKSRGGHKPTVSKRLFMRVQRRMVVPAAASADTA